MTKYFQHTCLILLLQVFLPANTLAQNPIPTEEEIDRFIEAKEFSRATEKLNARITHFESALQPDSLSSLTGYIGRIAFATENAGLAKTKVDEYITRVRKLNREDRIMHLLNYHAAKFFETINRNETAYHYGTLAFNFAAKTPGIKKTELFSLKTNLGTYAQRLGDIELSGRMHREAEKLLKEDLNPPIDNIYLSAYNLGAIMWYASKTDSALLYYNKALQALDKMPATAENQYYRPAILNNNLAAIFSLQGKLSEAMEAQRSVISRIRSFLNSPDPHPKKQSAIYLQYQATDNLAGFYKELGDFRKAHELLTYSYEQKKQNLPKEDPDLFKSQILIGQIHYAMKDYDRAERFLTQGLEALAKAGGNYILWEADAYYALALLNDIKQNEIIAQSYYEKADALYLDALQGNYDYIYLDFLRNASTFYAEQKSGRKALEMSLRAHRYIISTEGKMSLSHFYQLLNLSEIHFKLGDFKKALEYSKEGLLTVNTINSKGQNLLDSIKTELRKPKAILYKVKCDYQLAAARTPAMLQSMLAELDGAIEILERRKAIIQDPEDISLLMSDHEMLLQFIKTITLELYRITGNNSYAEQLVSVHESGIYNRIRSRMDKNRALRFAHLPERMVEKENELKEKIRNSLLESGPYDQQMNSYLGLLKEWDSYMENLRRNYPAYYQMRYSAITRSVKDARSKMPADLTIVRYLFVDSMLYAFVTDKIHSRLVQLNSDGIQAEILAVSDARTSKPKLGESLYSLYQKLWAPIAGEIRHKKILIIPDGILFNLNFEVLSPQKIHDYNDLASNTLLAKHPISYHYSMFLRLDAEEKKSFDKNFVAFAPGFTDETKAIYRNNIKDSSITDFSYLSLLPQPFTISLAEKLKLLFNGNAFLKERSTLNTFRKNAGNHKIIHIGTHAEANNVSPEFSRLIFTKESEEEKNAIYLFDLYNCDLRSSLTVLTACESGKPGYKDGEGMISLAHAFNYAGSESIITGLWKIDEQASAKLMDLFYDKLKKGLDKDEALQQAKLQYLQTNTGRLQSPAYWAGLVLVGDGTPIRIQTNAYPILAYLVIGGLFVTTLLFIFLHKKNGKIKVGNPMN